MRTYSAREHAWQRELDGIELAGFRPRLFAFLIDWLIVCIVVSLFATVITAAYVALRAHHLHSLPAAVNFGQPIARGYHFNVVKPEGHSLADEILKTVTDILIPILYFGILLWRTQGQTIGKRLMKIRVVSIVHPHLSFWHAVERALGYGAAALEAGFGFFQYFIHPYRRCAQDRLAETIVVTEAAYQQMLTTRDSHNSHEPRKK